MKILYNINTRKLSDYPRSDDEDVVGLSSEYLIFDLVLAEDPEYDNTTHQLEYSEIIDVENRIVVRGRNKSPIILSPLQIFQNKINLGYLVLPENFILGIRDYDRNLFTQLLTLVQEALSLNIIDNTTEQSITDISGNTIKVSTLRLRQILVGYGFYYKTIWDESNQ